MSPKRSLRAHAGFAAPVLALALVACAPGEPDATRSNAHAARTPSARVLAGPTVYASVTREQDEAVADSPYHFIAGAPVETVAVPIPGSGLVHGR
jgi:hypothetical protein